MGAAIPLRDGGFLPIRRESPTMDARRSRLAPLAALVALVVVAGPARALEGYQPARPDAPPVTPENLLANELFWPYRAELTEAWRPKGQGKLLPAGSRGVLVRVESPREARIDFGRDGVHPVPVDVTDLVEGANQVRRGERPKPAPNLVHAIGPRLTDSASETPRHVAFPEVFRPLGFLAVFADPEAEGFEELAAALAPLHERHGVWTVLFPQGGHADPQVREKLRSLDWTVPFVRDFLVEGYTRSRLPEGTPLPAVMLQTPEGRLLFQAPWKPEVTSRLRSSLDAAFGDDAAAPASTAGSEKEPTPRP